MITIVNNNNDNDSSKCGNNNERNGIELNWILLAIKCISL